MKPAETQSRGHLFRDVQVPVVLLNVTGNLNLGAVSVGMPFLVRDVRMARVSAS
jgi:hypothetical protein